MKEVLFPYGKNKLSHVFGGELSGVLEPKLGEYIPEADGAELVRRAMAEPVASPRLSELARGNEL